MRSNVGILGKLLADWQQQPVQRHGVGHFRRPADRAEQNGVERLKCLDAVGRHHHAGVLVEGAGPWKSGAIERDPRMPGGSFEHRPCSFRHVAANAVAWNERDRIVLH